MWGRAGGSPVRVVRGEGVAADALLALMGREAPPLRTLPCSFVCECVGVLVALHPDVGRNPTDPDRAAEGPRVEDAVVGWSVIVGCMPLGRCVPVPVVCGKGDDGVNDYGQPN